MEKIKQHKKIIAIVLGVIILAIVIVLIVTKKQGGLTPQTLQEQIESSKELKEVVTSPRNNFKSGNLSLDKSASKIDWSYGTESGTISMGNGDLSVLATGRIEGFDVNFNLNDLTSTGTPVKSIIQKFLSGDSKGNFKASLVLPNTVDDAFTISYTINAGGKTVSLASGMYVEKVNENNIKVSGEINIDPKTSLAMPDAKDTLKFTPVFVFK